MRVSRLAVIAGVLLAGFADLARSQQLSAQNVELLPHATYAREIVAACPQSVQIARSRQAQYKKLIAAFDELRTSRPGDHARWFDMAKQRAKSHSRAEFAQMMAGPNPVNVFLEPRGARP
jgi:hypothetical protein